MAATTHDYTKCGWGHDYCIHKIVDGGRQLHMSGWGRGISAGDFIVLTNGSRTTRYRFETVDYYADPNDMWSATVSFAPRGPPKESASTEESVLASCAAVVLLASVVMSLGVAWAAL